MEKNSPAQRLKSYLTKLKTVVNEIDLDKQVYKEGTKVNQVAYHAAQSANFWMRVKIMGLEFERDKDAEYGSEHSLEDINKSIDLAIEATEIFANKKLNLDDKLSEETPMGEMIIDSVGGGLIFITAHTAEHTAELTMIHDYLSSKE
ncbi:MAG TPA: hypothetical protein VHE53_04365 [Patescibacteria group bacterium]|nr:hypothetical protein [Patescibacteria group bacterium]